MSNSIAQEPAPRHADLLLLGRGGMGMVHLATRAPARRRVQLVVVKRPHEVLRGDARLMTMFAEEAAITLRLAHPNLVRGLESGVEDGVPFLSMEYVAGASLYNILRRATLWQGLPLHVHLRILADACAGLHHLHELRDEDGLPLALVHRDVSPQNIVVSYSGRVKVCDFGLTASEVECHSKLSGRISYMAPEVLRGGSFDRRADVYAMGALLWQAAVGRRLFAGDTEASAFATVAGRAAPSAETVNPAVPLELAAIIARALTVDAAERTATMKVLGSEIEAFLAEFHPTTEREVAGCVSRLFGIDRRRTNRSIVAKLRALGALGPATCRIVIGELTLPPLSERNAQSATAPTLPAAASPTRTLVAITAALVIAAAFALFVEAPGHSPTAPDASALADLTRAECSGPGCR